MERSKTKYPGIYRYEGRRGNAYQVVYRSRRGDGPQRAKSFPTLREAKDFQISVGHGIRSGTYFDDRAADISLSDFFEEFMRLAGPRETKSIALYRGNFRNHIEPALGEHRLLEVGPSEIAELLATVREKKRRVRGSGDATVRQVYVLVHRIFAVAARLGRVSTARPNPANGLAPPKPPPREVTPLEVSEVELVAEAIGSDLRAMVLIMGLAGLRVGEACGLRWQDVDLDGSLIVVRRALKESGGKKFEGTPKDDDAREVDLPEMARNALREHKLRSGVPSPEQHVFSAPRGGWLWPSTFTLLFKRAVETAKLNPAPTPHVLRATAASLMSDAGLPEWYIQQQLGHGSGQITRGYVKKYARTRGSSPSRFNTYLGASPKESRPTTG